MRLLHPAAADHSMSISRQQVQRIFSFSLRSRADTSFCFWLDHLTAERMNSTSWARSSEDSLAGGTALQRSWFFLCRVDCTHQAALPPVCVTDDHLPCVLQHAKIVFSLKEHSWVFVFLKMMLHLANLTLRLYKDELGLASDNVSPVCF